MKKVKSVLSLMFFVLMLSSCYQQRIIVGNGPQGNKEITEWNHYLIGGLAPVDVADVTKMADGAADYEVWNRHTFVNGLIQVLTFGIYTPSMTTVYK